MFLTLGLLNEAAESVDCQSS